MYRTAKATLIGEAIVRLSKTGDFELTVSKGPGITLLSLRQDAAFAEFNASFTGQRWSGPPASAPPQSAIRELNEADSRVDRDKDGDHSEIGPPVEEIFECNP